MTPAELSSEEKALLAEAAPQGWVTIRDDEPEGFARGQIARRLAVLGMLRLSAASMEAIAYDITSAGRALLKGTRAVFTLAEGDVVITFPSSLSMESVADLDGYLRVLLRRMRRDAEALPVPDEQPTAADVNIVEIAP
jgi:hypothetical protein